VLIFASVAETGLGATQDFVREFESGVDHIDLSGIGGLQFIDGAFGNVAGEVRFDAGLMQLQIDVDGDGFADGSLQLDTALLTAGDLIL